MRGAGNGSRSASALALGAGFVHSICMRHPGSRASRRCVLFQSPAPVVTATSVCTMSRRRCSSCATTALRSCHSAGSTRTQTRATMRAGCHASTGTETPAPSSWTVASSRCSATSSWKVSCAVTASWRSGGSTSGRAIVPDPWCTLRVGGSLCASNCPPASLPARLSRSITPRRRCPRTRRSCMTPRPMRATISPALLPPLLHLAASAPMAQRDLRAPARRPAHGYPSG